MPQFSITSKQKLATCHSDLQILFNYIIQDRDCTIAVGHRNEKDQNKAFADGNSQKRWPESKHNTVPSLAVDAVPYEKSGMDWGKLQSSEWSGYVLGVANTLFREGKMKHKIRRGADWDCDFDVDDTTFWDACHFEIIPS